jgi:hypothetical protein
LNPRRPVDEIGRLWDTGKQATHVVIAPFVRLVPQVIQGRKTWIATEPGRSATCQFGRRSGVITSPSLPASHASQQPKLDREGEAMPRLPAVNKLADEIRGVGKKSPEMFAAFLIARRQQLKTYPSVDVLAMYSDREYAPVVASPRTSRRPRRLCTTSAR